MKVKVTIIGGKVHDVGYRPFLLDLADSLLIERFDARNVVIEGKQAVVVLVEGDENQINQFIELIKENKPENAVVEEIKIEEYKGFVRSIDSYRQSLMVSQLNKIVQVGLQMLHKQDLMLQKQDLMLQKQDQMLQKQDETMKIIREESEKTREYLGRKIDQAKDEVVQEIRELRMDLKMYLDERLKKIEEEINTIKSKLGMV
jgi:acylphosphatase